MRENSFKIPKNVLGPTAASGCQSYPTFQRMTPSPSSECYWWLSKTKPAVLFV